MQSSLIINGRFWRKKDYHLHLWFPNVSEMLYQEVKVEVHRDVFCLLLETIIEVLSDCACLWNNAEASIYATRRSSKSAKLHRKLPVQSRLQIFSFLVDSWLGLKKKCSSSYTLWGPFQGKSRIRLILLCRSVSWRFRSWGPSMLPQLVLNWDWECKNWSLNCFDRNWPQENTESRSQLLMDITHEKLNANWMSGSVSTD